MHESGMIEDLIRKVEEAARANAARKVTAVDVSVGALAAIEPDHLREHFVIASAGTLAEGAELRIRVSDDPLAADPHAVMLQSVEIES